LKKKLIFFITYLGKKYIFKKEKLIKLDRVHD